LGAVYVSPDCGYVNASVAEGPNRPEPTGCRGMSARERTRFWTFPAWPG